MTTFLVQHFDALKKLVLAKGESNNVTPSDCKSLSTKIFKKTNQQVSETTLKRVYGFAYSKFNPSLFTMDAMAKYCGYTGWVDFCEKNEIKGARSKDTSWETIKHNANKITNFTLQALKNKSGIPYNQTIKRKFIYDHFDAFLKDDYTATVLMGPAGYGKTLALCHWVEDKLALSTLGKNSDIILFFSSNALINVFISGKDINEWLLSLLGYGSEDDFLTLLDINKKHEGNFYLVIDGLDEHMFRSEQFYLLLNQVLDVFSFYQFYESFKLVLTMRSATWLNHKHEIENFKNKWFPGYMVSDDLATNVPLFTINEIKEVCTNINPAIQDIISVDIAENFSHPLYLQSYYKQHKGDFTLNDADHVSIYELISDFILNKIYLGAQSAEKTTVIWAFLRNLDLVNGIFEVQKLKINDSIKQNIHAYNDLLSIGFLREVNKSADMKYNTVIQFTNNNFLYYSLARFLLAENNNIFDLSLIHKINELFKGERKVNVLKWCMVYAIKNEQFQSFEYFAEAHLNNREKAEILVFVGDLLEKLSKSINGNESMLQYLKQDCNEGFFDYFFGLEFINLGYKKTLLTLLKLDLSPKRKIIIYTSLALIAVKQLNVNKLEEYLITLRGFRQGDMQTLPINPLSCLETIYYFYKYGIVKNEAFAELTKFYFNPPKTVITLKNDSTNYVLYVLSLYTLSICHTPHKVLRFINAINKIHDGACEISPGFKFIKKCLAAEAYLALNKTAEAINIYNELAPAYEIEKDSYTQFMQASFYLLKAKMGLYIGEKTDIQQVMKSLIISAEEEDFKLIKIQALIFIITNKDFFNIDEAYYKYAYYEFTKIIRENGLSEESFVSNGLTEGHR